MKTCVIGCGLGGISASVMLAESKNKVKLFDSDDLTLKIVSKGQTPFYEPGLSTLLAKGIRARRISVQDNFDDAVSASDFIFIAVQTPILKSGAVNLAALREAAEDMGPHLSKGGKTVIFRCVVPPGTAETELVPLLEKHSGMKAGRELGVAVFPAFVRPGLALKDSIEPARIVIGGDSKKTAARVMGLFDSFKCPKITTDLTTAEAIKYATSVFLATKISYSNEMANLCERYGIDVEDVLEGVGLDPRINHELLSPGVGYGGWCLPKDLMALTTSAEAMGYRPELTRAVRKINESQPIRAVEMLEEELGGLDRKRIALLGLAYKAGVDDVTETKAFPIAIELLAKGAKVVGYDPLATGAFMRVLPGITFGISAREALLDADGCIIQTEEEEFKRLDKEDFGLMRNKVVVDGRRILSPIRLARWGVKLRAIGLGKK